MSIADDVRAARVIAWDCGTLMPGAAWSEHLDAAEIKLLAQGVSPLNIRPRALVLYIPAIYAPPCGCEAN